MSNKRQNSTMQYVVEGTMKAIWDRDDMQWLNLSIERQVKIEDYSQSIGEI